MAAGMLFEVREREPIYTQPVPHHKHVMSAMIVQELTQIKADNSVHMGCHCPNGENGVKEALDPSTAHDTSSKSQLVSISLMFTR